jgi:hypothetical protein
MSGKDSDSRTEKEDRKKGDKSNSSITQQMQKITAQQILKNNQMIGKYDNLDGQLQNIQFEYYASYLEFNKCK